MIQKSSQCCIGGKQKMIGSTGLTLAAGATGTITFDTFAGRFCIQHVFAIFDATAGNFAFTSWKIGADELIIGGFIHASLFAPSANCCPILCLDCVCSPGVPMTIRVLNAANDSQNIQISIVGCYEEECLADNRIIDRDTRSYAQYG